MKPIFLVSYFWFPLLFEQFEPDPSFEAAKKFIKSGVFGNYDYAPLIDSLEGNEGFGRGDYFLVGKDFPSYIKAQDRVDEAYRDQEVSALIDCLLTFATQHFYITNHVLLPEQISIAWILILSWLFSVLFCR